MRPQFALFQSHLDLAHNFWKKIIQPGDSVVDATLGNGYDALVLAKLASGILYGFDIQKVAINATKERLASALDTEAMQKVRLYELCHSKIAEIVPKESVKLIVYNLGYLPGQDKSLTTKKDTTVLSIQESLNLILPGGLISITCYPGHEAGLIEDEAVTRFCETLDPKVWNASSHRFLNRKLHPHVICLQKQMESQQTVHP